MRKRTIERAYDMEEEEIVKHIMQFFWDMGIAAMRIETDGEIQFIPMPHIYENRTTVH